MAAETVTHDDVAPLEARVDRLLEVFEALEQLRVLWHGYAIMVARVEQAPPAGVDTPQDLERVRALFAAA